MTWELVEETQETGQDEVFELCRAKVPGGWLYRAQLRAAGGFGKINGYKSVSITFVPYGNPLE